MKIERLMIAYYGRRRENLWSGTLDVFDNFLSLKLGVNNIKWIRIFPEISILYQKILRLYSIFFYTSDGVCREKQMYKSTVKMALNGLNRDFDNKTDWVLFVAEHCLNSKFPEDIHYAAYIDTDFPVTAQYDVARSKIGYDYYIKNYDKYTEESYKKLNLIFTQNEWTRLSIIDRFKLNSNKVINVGFGVNIEPYFEEKNYENDLLLIVLRQHNAKTKGLDLLVDAFKLLRRENENVRLAIVGNDYYKGVEGIDVYIDYPREKTKELFRSCTLYTMPSRNEPNGITYLEALCNKAPIVGLNRFSIPEFTNNGEWGFLCENEDPLELATVIADALSDKLRLKGMGLKGQEFVMNNYKWEKVVEFILNSMSQYEKQ